MKNRSQFKRKTNAMLNKAIELGFKNSLEAQKAGYNKELKKAFNEAK